MDRLCSSLALVPRSLLPVVFPLPAADTRDKALGANLILQTLAGSLAATAERCDELLASAVVRATADYVASGQRRPSQMTSSELMRYMLTVLQPQLLTVLQPERGLRLFSLRWKSAFTATGGRALCCAASYADISTYSDFAFGV